MAGVFLPLLPTTPFLLVAAWAAAKSSPRLHRWLYSHPRFGPVLCAWRDEGAVPTRAKLLATITMLVSWIILWLLGSPVRVLIFLALMFSAVLLFLWSRPRPQRSHS